MNTALLTSACLVFTKVEKKLFHGIEKNYVRISSLMGLDYFCTSGNGDT